jgi:hypothetical protein
LGGGGGTGRREIRQNTNEYKRRPRDGNIWRRGKVDEKGRGRKGNRKVREEKIRKGTREAREEKISYIGRGRKGTRKAKEEKIS